MAAALPEGTPIIRCMPNTPAAIGEGMMALCAGPGVAAEACELTQALFAASGSVAWIEDEALMDAVTAISGSGPAYVFHFVEALTAAAVALGLPEQTAALLAKQTVAGAGRMALQSDTPPGTLREQVTSPGGTTAAALAVLMAEDRLANLVAEATAAARDRGVELGREG
jgi:pyrroline-5-carboxylate reductase